ncbi:MAG: leucine-rich repeat protein, partial [Alistipes sp.]|nr:leucine-rich repeat protein [Alistipes sp.]
MSDSTLIPASLEKVVLTDVTEIAHAAFYGCNRIKEIVVPETVTKIGGSAFVGCTALTKVNIE